MMNHPPLQIGGLPEINELRRVGVVSAESPPLAWVCSAVRYGGGKVSHEKVWRPRAVRAGLSCFASSRLRRLAPSGFNPSSERHGKTRPSASSGRPAGDTVTAAPTPCPCSAARYDAKQNFLMRKSAAPRVGWVALAPRASIDPFDGRDAADESRCARPSAAIDPCSTACRSVPDHKRGGGLPRLRPGQQETQV